MPLRLSIDFRLDEEQLPSFTQWLTQWQTWLTYSVCVTESRMLYSLPSSCLVHAVDRFDSEGWFSCNQVIFKCVLWVFGKKHAAFKWKDVISRFPVSPDSAEALVRWGWKIKYILTAYFLGNICAKNYHKRTMCVKITVSQRWDVVLRHSVTNSK